MVAAVITAGVVPGAGNGHGFHLTTMAAAITPLQKNAIDMVI